MKLKRMMGLLLGTVLCAAGILSAEVPVQDFTLKGVDGKSFSLHEVLGKKTVVINFWAAWCTSCSEEIPELKALMAAKGADKAVFIGVNAGENERKAQRFLEKNGYPYRIVIDPDKSVVKQYGVLGLPTTIIISKDKQIVYRGSRPPKNYEFK